MTGHFHGEENVPFQAHPGRKGSDGQARASRKRRDLCFSSPPTDTECPQRPVLSLIPRQACTLEAQSRPGCQQTFLHTPLGPWLQFTEGSHLLGRSLAWIPFMLSVLPQSHPFRAKTELCRWDRRASLSSIIIFESPNCKHLLQDSNYLFSVNGIPVGAGRGQKFKGFIS